MVAFRKWFPALALLTLILGSAVNASAQQTPLVCQTNAGVPPIVRAEGFTELVGDIVINCTGGNPAANFLANFQVFLNTNVTSRLQTSSISEALLLIDEPDVSGLGRPTAPFCPSPDPASNPNAITACNPVTAGSAFQSGTYTVFRGARPAIGENSIVWAGVPIIPPGSQTRTIRITNLRANAAGLGTSNTLIPTQIVAFVSVSASQSLALNNPQQTVAFIQQGLQFDVRSCNNDSVGTLANFSQCVSQNGALFTDPTRRDAGNLSQIGLRFREGFQTAFKRRVETSQLTSVPGVVYNTESGFVRSGDSVLGNAGLADSGTRLAARFNNVPAGVRLFATIRDVGNVAGAGLTPINRSTPNLDAVLVQTGLNGEGGFSSTPGGAPVGVATGATIRCGAETASIQQDAAEIPIVSGTGLAVWEVTNADPSAIDDAFFIVAVAFAANTPNNLPGIGVSTVTGNFAPFYATSDTVSRMSTSLPIPRFVDNPVSRTDFRIDECVTNLLFPFVTNQAGFDTGIAISNTSRDVFTTQSDRLQNGTCTINYFGETAAGGAAPAAQTTNAVVEAGKQLTFVLSSGGGLGIAGTPGFQGYIIARCRFQYAHGFAFITDGPIGRAQVAEGYLALVMDAALPSRTGSISETLGH